MGFWNLPSVCCLPHSLSLAGGNITVNTQSFQNIPFEPPASTFHPTPPLSWHLHPSNLLLLICLNLGQSFSYHSDLNPQFKKKCILYHDPHTCIYKEPKVFMKYSISFFKHTYFDPLNWFHSLVSPDQKLKSIVRT